MKFTATKGQDYREVLQRIEAFLRENAEGYTILQSNMNIYFDLCNVYGDICSKNASEYKVTKDAIYDPDDVAVNNLINQWKCDAVRKLESLINDIVNLPKKAESIKKKLDKAVENGFGTVDKWKQELAKVEKEQENASKNLDFYNSILYCIQHDIISYESRIIKTSSSTFIYTRPIVDKKGNYLPSPLYFYKNGFSFDNKQDYKTYWISNLNW